MAVTAPSLLLLLHLYFCGLFGEIHALQAPTLFWASYPVLPNETVMIAGAGFDTSDSDGSNLRSTTVTVQLLSNTSTPPIEVTAAKVTSGVIQVTLPASLPLDAYNISVNGSAPISVNAPDIWWAMGDTGNASTPGGWLRVFGRGLSLSADAALSENQRTIYDVQSLAAAVQSAIRRNDFGEVERLSSQQVALAKSAQQQRSQLQTTLTLSPVSTHGAKVVLTAPLANLSTVSATFPLPTSVLPGVYAVSISNGATSATMDSFISPTMPHVSTIRVVAAAAVAFPTKRFEVSSYGCSGGANSSAMPINCTGAALAAINDAGANGGGEVYFGVGRWYLTGPLLLPNNVVLKGAGMDLTAIYFASANTSTAPSSHIAPAEHNATKYVRYGVEDLAIYILSYYNNVFKISADTDGVKIRRVRVRANAFHCGNENSRLPDWTFRGGGFNPLIWVHGINFEVSDCDFWSTWSVIHSSGIYSPSISGWVYDDWQAARYGVVQRNTIYNGGSCHWFDQAKQIVFEDNVCIGNNPMTMGNNIDTYGGGYAQHVYIGSNDISQVWGNDREVMTYDNAGTSYFGPVSSVSPDGLTYTVKAGSVSVHSFTAQAAGGLLVVVNGTGAGQYRRVVNASMIATAPTWTFTVDSPLDASVTGRASDGGSDGYIQLMPLRGRNIFHRTHYADCGAFQFYGLGVDNIIYGVSMARGGGFGNWGQWRGDFANPNLRNQWIGNTVVEGLRAEHESKRPGAEPGSFGDALQFNGNAFAIVDAPVTNNTAVDQRSAEMNRLIVFRRNRVQSNGGFDIGAAVDVLLEGSSVQNTPRASISGQSTPFRVSPIAQGVFLRGNEGVATP